MSISGDSAELMECVPPNKRSFTRVYCAYVGGEGVCPWIAEEGGFTSLSMKMHLEG